MKCQDVRRALSFLVHGELPLTEWAIIQVHLRDCAECQQEFDRVRGQAAGRVRARRRLAVAALGGTAVLLVAAAGGFYAYQSGRIHAPARSDSFRLPSWGTAPPPRPVVSPEPEPTTPVAPALAAPPPARARPVVEPPPRVMTPPLSPAPDPVPGAARPATTAVAPTEERMPTQARPAAAPPAAPGAEAMPTQATPRAGPRGR